MYEENNKSGARLPRHEAALSFQLRECGGLRRGDHRISSGRYLFVGVPAVVVRWPQVTRLFEVVNHSVASIATKKKKNERTSAQNRVLSGK